MALYTETLYEWMEDGGELPASFAAIPNLSDAFTYRFIDCEIGFETPDLFGLKLKGRALEVMPDATAKYEQLLKETYAVPERSSKTKTTIGKRRSTASDWPTNPTAGTEYGPTSVSGSDEASDASETTATGMTIDEQERRAEWLRNQTRSLIESVCGAFENLFMKVY